MKCMDQFFGFRRRHNIVDSLSESWDDRGIKKRVATIGDSHKIIVSIRHTEAGLHI